MFIPPVSSSKNLNNFINELQKPQYLSNKLDYTFPRSGVHLKRQGGVPIQFGQLVVIESCLFHNQ